MVSIPSGRGFWAGLFTAPDDWGHKSVSIPSGRGFWAGPSEELTEAVMGQVSQSPVASHIKWFCFI